MVAFVKLLAFFILQGMGDNIIVCDIPVKILPTIRMGLPAIITIKSSC